MTYKVPSNSIILIIILIQISEKFDIYTIFFT